MHNAVSENDTSADLEESESESSVNTGEWSLEAERHTQGLCLFDEQLKIQFCNQAFQAICSLASADFKAGMSLDVLLAKINDEKLSEYIGDTIRFLDRKETPDHDDAKATKLNLDNGRSVNCSAERLPDGGVALLAQSEVSGAKVRPAEYPKDELTQLAIRGTFRSELDRHIEAANDDMSEVAVLFLDLDHFKPVNDTLGHQVGDEALKIVADRLQKIVRSHDLVARLGGDEFAILQTEAEQPNGSRALARRIIDRISSPMEIQGQMVTLGVSIGVAVAPMDADNSQDLIRFADLAMYRAKNEGSNLIRYFEPEMESQLLQKRSIEMQIGEALERDEFSLRYQPLMNIETEEICSIESLIRWDDSKIETDEFIAIAESSGLIERLGAWVLRSACEDAAGWDSDVSVAVNVSPRQLQSRTFYETVYMTLRETDFPAERLELEITETVLLKDTEMSLAMLTDLKDLGVRIVMDDFGTGYSSINLLRQFPFDKIKIDRTFITGLDQDTDEAELLQIIASLGTCLAIGTTAEGVETLKELEIVKSAGCSEVQGYLLSRPVKNSQLKKMLADQNLKIGSN